MKQKTADNRIAELDAARGIAVVCMVILHVYAFGEEFGGWDRDWVPFFRALMDYGGAFFVFLSGVCAVLGSRSVKRGLIVFACGMCLTALTVWLYLSGREPESILIQWGALHCIGMCMMLWPLFRKMPVGLRAAAGAVIAAAGYYLRLQVHVRNPWLFPLGLRTWHFVAFDYFPMLPHLGWFLCGSALGSLIYRDRRPLFPSLEPGVLAFIGRHSLAIYMIHEPLLYVFFRFGGTK